MYKKQTIRLDESQLMRIVSESVEMVLREGKYTNHVPYFPFSNRPYSMKARPGQPVDNPDLSGPELEKHNTRAREKYYTDSNGNPKPYDPSERNPNYYLDLQREENDPMVYWVHRAKKVLNSEIGYQQFVYDFYRENEDLM